MTLHLRSRLVSSAVACLVLALGAGEATAQDVLSRGGQPRVPEIASSLRPRLQRNGQVRVIVELRLAGERTDEARLPNRSAIDAQRSDIAATRSRLLARLSLTSHRLVRQYASIPLVALEVGSDGLAALEAAGADVWRVNEDVLLLPSLADSVPLVQGDQAWAAGFDGTGTTIAVVDTGVESTHPFLAGKVDAEACFSTTIAGTSTSVCPNGQVQQIGPGAAVPCLLGGCEHGTHVAGIASGNGLNSGLPFSGVARGAHIVAVQVFSRIDDPNSCGGIAPCLAAWSSDVIAGLEHVYSIRGSHNFASVNLSLGGGRFSSSCDTEPFKPVIDNLRAAGIPSVVASGNSGYTDALSVPACVSSAVSVGSTSKADAISWFSNVSPMLSLLAPGESILSSVPGGALATFSGTSMAAPHVAGAWAVLKQAAPSASVSAVLSALQTTGLPIADTRFFGTVTAPRIRVFQALSALAGVVNPAPEITSVTPDSVVAGAATLTLTVNGANFVAGSVVQWNGAARATTVVNATKLSAVIPAADLATPLTAQITVVTPAPGGGTTAPLSFTVKPGPKLTVSATTVNPGGTVTATLTNGPGGATDWLALSRVGDSNLSFLQWVYVGAGVTTRTWTVTLPTTAGSYEFRLYLANGYTRAATSPAVVVPVVDNPVPAIVSLSPSTARAGDAAFTLNVNGSGFVAASVVRWNGTARTTTFVSATSLRATISSADLSSTATATVTVFNPVPGGGTSAEVSFTIASPPVLSVSATRVGAASPVTVTLAGGFGGSTDWLAFALTTAANTSYVQWTYVGAGVTTRTWTVTTPAAGGIYEFRFFRNGGYVRAATSPTVTVDAPPPAPSPSLAVSATSVAPGASVTVTLTNGAGGATDWLALAATGSGNLSYLQWTYVGAGVTTRTWTVSMPTAAGTYEFRLFLSNGYTRVAVSPTVTVSP